MVLFFDFRDGISNYMEALSGRFFVNLTPHSVVLTAPRLSNSTAVPVLGSREDLHAAQFQMMFALEFFP